MDGVRNNVAVDEENPKDLNSNATRIGRVGVGSSACACSCAVVEVVEVGRVVEI